MSNLKKEPYIDNEIEILYEDEFGKEYYRDGKLHKLDGPACEYVNGKNKYYIQGICLSEEEFNKKNPEFKVKLTWHKCKYCPGFWFDDGENTWETCGTMM